MRLSRTTTRRSVVIALIATILVAPFLAWQSAQGGEGPPSLLAPRGIVVVGDSITARYDDKPGGPYQGWWSIVARHFAAKARTYAQSGSGYLRPGLAHESVPCAGNRFIDRDQVYTGTPPSMVIIEGGRNDWSVCRDGQYVPSSDAEVQHAVDSYLDVLKTFLPDTTRIVVLGPPWGPLDREDGVRVTRIVRASAQRHGVQFISTWGALNKYRVIDGIHPNRLGSQAIADRVIRALT